MLFSVLASCCAEYVDAACLVLLSFTRMVTARRMQCLDNQEELTLAAEVSLTLREILFLSGAQFATK